MTMTDERRTGESVSRRDFLKAASVGTASLVTAAACDGTRASRTASAGAIGTSGAGPIRVGVIGCGYRGTGAALDCVEANPDVVVTALGDLFPDMVESAFNRLWWRVSKDNLAVPPERRFSGFDAYRKVLAADVDLVILAAPPFFRPVHFQAAVDAGKHVFMEKPVAVDPPGVRSVFRSAEIASQKGLAVVAGTQRRHQAHYLEIMKRVHDGEIGEVTGAQCYWNQGDLWVERATENWSNRTKRQWSDMEWQIRNWLFTLWCSGDHIVEQHVHNIDVINWALNSHPLKATAIGGRAARTHPMFGNVFDHFAVEYEYPNGVRVMSMCRQIHGSADNISERVVGTRGVAYTDSADGRIEGARPYRPDVESPNPYVVEHADLVRSIRAGRPLNEGRQVAESTLTAIMGRMSAYTGRSVSWSWVMNASSLDLTPPHMEMKALPPLEVAVPGKTKLA